MITSKFGLKRYDYLTFKKIQAFYRVKDSLWQAEDIDAVFDQDPQRVCILQGPVAAKHSRVKDQSIADILGDISNGLIRHVLDNSYDGNESQVPTVDYLGGPINHINSTPL